LLEKSNSTSDVTTTPKKSPTHPKPPEKSESQASLFPQNFEIKKCRA